MPTTPQIKCFMAMMVFLPLPPAIMPDWISDRYLLPLTPDEFRLVTTCAAAVWCCIISAATIAAYIYAMLFVFIKPALDLAIP